MKFLLKFIGIIVIAAVIYSCGNSTKNGGTKSNMHTVVAKEVIQAGDYTYVLVSENDSDIWVAAPTVEAVVGKTYYYEGGMKMTNFKSKELKRTFESVYFIENLSAEPIKDKKADTATELKSTGSKNRVSNLEVEIEPAKDGITISELYKNKDKYSGKTVKVKGVVAKFSAEIMDKNLIHLQDGTEYSGDFDLTVTTNIEVEKGDTVTMEGKIALDKDFGYNYFYKVIMEDAIKK